MVFTFLEVIDALLMTFLVGFIFSGFFKKEPQTREEVYASYEKPRSWIDWDALLFAAMITAPAILLHELGHKIAALGFGMVATFHAAYLWLFLGVVLKLLQFPFIFFVPAYVSWGCSSAVCQASLSANPWIGSIIAIAGPLVNLLLWFGAWAYLRWGKPKRKWIQALVLTKRINLFLFVFNMLPLPPFDGFHFFAGLWHTFI
ncbi:MAG: M50 family metallopeptidase [Candidatus Woesearchaeota archaeon]